GTLGTLIGAGGGFLLVPLLLLFYPDLKPESVTAISMAVVACNAISGTAAYIRAKRIDYKAGLVFAAATIPGSILGVWTTKIIPRHTFDLIFGIVLIALSVFLFVGKSKTPTSAKANTGKKLTVQSLTDKWGEIYNYAYDLRKGILLSLLVGYFSPLLGIGGGIIHVPAMVQWLSFPVHVATATSHFVLAIMATVSVAVHFFDGSYNDPQVVRMVLGLSLGVIPGAQLGAYLSRRIQAKTIVKALAVSLALVGVRILVSYFF
ncbi:MAG: sulfite exporter TauE/SafE family protein, partial [Flavobacterium sp.]